MQRKPSHFRNVMQAYASDAFVPFAVAPVLSANQHGPAAMEGTS